MSLRTAVIERPRAMTAMSLARRLLREPRRPAAIRRSPRAQWYVVAAVCVGAFMGQLDASIVTVALPHIGASLGTSAGAVRWVALSYVLVLAVTLVAVGILADRVGRKLLYTYGFAVFTAGSALCGLAPSLGWLIAARVLQGLGAAMLQANSVALIAAALPRGDLAQGLGVQGAAQACGLALGPLLGGVLLALSGWRVVFLVNVPAGVLGLVLGWVLLPRSHPAPRSAVVAGVSPGRARCGPLFGPCSARVRTHAHTRGGVQIFDNDTHPDPSDRATLARGLGSAAGAYLVMFGALYVMTYLLAAGGVPVALAGAELAALPIALGIVAPIAGRLAGRDVGADRRHATSRRRIAGRSRIGGRRRIASQGATIRRAWLARSGLLAATLGLLTLAAFGDPAGRLCGLALLGAGLGTFIPVNNAGVMSTVRRERTGMLSGVLNTARSLATALGVALAGALYARHGAAFAFIALAAIALVTAMAQRPLKR